MKIYPYSQGSKSAKALAEALGCKRLKKQGRPHHAKDTVINWGCSVANFERTIYADMFLNPPEAVSRAANKLNTFKHFRAYPGGVPAPRWTESLVEASRWLAEGVCKTVVCRTKLTGHSGEGIVLASTQEQLVEAPLYTAYITKEQEYRIHVNQRQAFHVQRKARNKAVPDAEVNWKIRNHGNGFIFAHVGVDVPEIAKGIAASAVMALGLDFGAVDIILGKDGNWYVLEVNTACGLEGTTLEKYVEQFKQYV